MDSDSAALSGSEHPQILELDPDADVEEEWDELSSDVDEAFTDPVERIPGESLLPSLRLESIIQADGVMGSLALSKEGLFILSVATEEFIKRLAQGGHRQASVERRGSVSYRDMAATTQQYQEFMFLQETIPSPVSLLEALQLRELKEKEILENDPALTAPTTYSSTAGYTPSIPKPKIKTRVTNGKDKQNRHASGSSRPESRAPSQVRWDYEDVPASNGHNFEATSTRGGRESGWTRWPNGQNFINVDPQPQHNGFSSLAAQRLTTPSVNGHTPPTPPRPRDTEAPPVQTNHYQRTHSPWTTKGITGLDKHNLHGNVAPARQSTSNVNGLDPHPPSHAAVAAHESKSPIEDKSSTTAGSAMDGSGGSPSLVAQNPGRTIYSEKNPPQ